MEREAKMDGNEDELEEGELYVVKKGVLEHIRRDPDDSLKKIRITDDAFSSVVEVQKSMRGALNGYKPDITMVCSALLEQATQSDDALEVVKNYAVKVFQ